MAKYIKKRNANVPRPQPRRKVKLGLNLPRWAGGGGINFETSAKKLVRSVVKQELKKEDETKQLPFAFSSAALGANNLYTAFPWQGLNQGVTGNTRVGDQVYLRHLTMKCYMSNTTSQPTIKYRILGVWMDKKYPNASTVATATSSYFGGVDRADLFFPQHPVTSTAMINNKLEHTVVFDRLYTLNTEIGTRQTKTFKIDVPIMKKVTYVDNNLLKDDQFYIVIIPDGDIVPTGQAVGFLSCQGLLTYTDA